MVDICYLAGQSLIFSYVNRLRYAMTCKRCHDTKLVMGIGMIQTKCPMCDKANLDINNRVRGSEQSSLAKASNEKRYAKRAR